MNRMVFFYVYVIAERFTSDFGESLLPVLFSPTEPINRLSRNSVGNYRTSPLAYCPPGRYLCVWVYPGTSPLRSDVHRLLMVVP